MAGLSEKYINELNRNIKSIKSKINDVESSMDSMEERLEALPSKKDIPNIDIEKLKSDIISSIEKNGLDIKDFPVDEITENFKKTLDTKFKESIDGKLDRGELSINLEVPETKVFEFDTEELDKILFNYSKKLSSFDKELEKREMEDYSTPGDNIVIEAPGSEILNLEEKEEINFEENKKKELDINKLVNEIGEALKVPLENPEPPVEPEPENKKESFTEVKDYMDSVEKGIKEIPDSIDSFIEVIKDNPVELIQESTPDNIEDPEVVEEFTKKEPDAIADDEEGESIEDKLPELIKETSVEIDEINIDTPNIDIKNPFEPQEKFNPVDDSKSEEEDTIIVESNVKDTITEENPKEEEFKDTFEDYIEKKETEKKLEKIEEELERNERKEINEPPILTAEEIPKNESVDDDFDMVNINDTINNLTEVFEETNIESEDEEDKIIKETDTELIEPESEDLISKEIQTLIKETPKDNISSDIIEGNEKIALKLDELIKAISESSMNTQEVDKPKILESNKKKNREPAKKKTSSEESKSPSDSYGPETIRLLNQIAKSLSGPLRISDNKPHRPNSRFS